MDDIRWKQRFENFSRAFNLLRSALEERPLDSFSDLEQEGIIQRFKYTYALAWKTFKDYLEGSGLTIVPGTPRQVIKEAFSAGIIDDGPLWNDIMLHRNLLSHTYDMAKFREVLDAVVERYLAAFEKVHAWFLSRVSE